MDLLLRGRKFDFQSGHYQVVTAWMGNCEQVNHLGITNSAFHPSGVCKSSTGLPD